MESGPSQSDFWIIIFKTERFQAILFDINVVYKNMVNLQNHIEFTWRQNLAALR